MATYCQITYRERLRLYRGLLAGQTLGQIAHELGRHRSTIYREVRRNGSRTLGYLPDRAAKRVRLRRCHARSKMLHNRHGRRRLHRFLTHAKPRRTARSHRRHRSGKFLYITPISKRPELINQRACFGHWEADTVQFLPSLATVSITTMVERQTRFALVMKQPDKKTKTVMPVIKSALDRLPLAATPMVTDLTP